MKAILNDVIYDIEGKELTVENFDHLEDGKPTITPLKFCNIIYSKLLSTKPKGDIQTKEYFDLAEKMYNLSLIEPQETEITTGEYNICRDILSKERLIVQAKFLEMIERLNPIPNVTEEPILIENPIEWTPEEIHEEIPEETPEETNTQNIIVE